MTAPSRLVPRRRVLHLIESDGIYGAEQVVLSLAGSAAGDADLSAAIGCLVNDASGPHALHDRAEALGIPAFKFVLRKLSSAVDLLRLVRQIRRLGVDLIHAHGYKAEIAAYVAHRWYGIPAMVTCHLWFAESESKWTYRLLARVERRLYPRFPHVAAVSPRIAEQLRRWGVERDRLSEISNGITLSAPAAPAAVDALRRRHGIDAGASVILNVGRLAEQKAQADLVAAAKILKAAHRNVRVLILGEGHLRDTLDRQIARDGLGDVVQILGFQDNVNEYLSAADIFALPSVDEGLPVALLEALGAGVAVVCTPVGGIPSVLEHERTALFVPVHSVTALAQAIDRLITAPELRRALADRGQTLVRERYTAEAMYGRYHDLYVRLIGSGTPVAPAPGDTRGA